MAQSTIFLTITALCSISQILAEPPSYLPPYELSAPSPTFSSYVSPKPHYGTPSPSPFYNAPAPTPEYGPPHAAPVYRAPKPVYQPPRVYSKPKPIRYSPPAPVYSAPPPPPPATYLPAAPKSYGSHHNYEEYNSVPAHYMYQYDVHDHHFGTDFGHKESREGDTTHGQYMVLLPDGRRQIVEYVADKHGYRPTIRYEGEAMHHGGISGPY